VLGVQAGGGSVAGHMPEPAPCGDSDIGLRVVRRIDDDHLAPVARLLAALGTRSTGYGEVSVVAGLGTGVHVKANGGTSWTQNPSSMPSRCPRTAGISPASAIREPATSRRERSVDALWKTIMRLAHTCTAERMCKFLRRMQI